MGTAPSPRWLTDLGALCACHSTPGDEDAVARYLRASWEAAGWTVTGHGRAALSARRPGRSLGRRLRLLICAHMDSPGYCIEAIGPERSLAIPLGKPAFAGPSCEVVLKTGEDRRWLVLQREENEVGPASFWLPSVPGMVRGDRLCFHGTLEADADGCLRGPFLDNRLGCMVLCELARRLAEVRTGVEVVLGATACEEMGGFGAPVLARAVEPDMAVCLDATYDSPAQGVRLGGGPVLTLSDASVLLGCRERDVLLALAGDAGIPLQTEAYNYSGTDAKAFPHAGLPGRVFPLLLATTGNHTPAECAHRADIEGLLDLIEALCAGRVWRSLLASGF